MSIQYLPQIYKSVFDEEFNYGDFDKRLKMQKAVYMLEQIGLGIGNYGFFWYKHGPYSQRLQDDMHASGHLASAEFEFSDAAIRAISVLREMLQVKKETPISYSLQDWIECLASLKYIKDNRIHNGASADDIIALLESEKQHLNNNISNRRAFECINTL